MHLKEQALLTDGAVSTTVHTVKTSAGIRKAGLQVPWLSPDLKLLLNMILRNICAKNLRNICAKHPLSVRPKKDESSRE